jgi:GNAT superfamily N-acetyltransferase
MAVRRATAEDVTRIAAVLAEAFSTDAPMRWFLGGPQDGTPLLHRYFEAMAPRIHMRHGEAWVSDDPPGAALWLEPGHWPMPLRDELAMAPTLLRTFGRHPLRGLAGLRALERDPPTDEHWFLDFIGVAANARSRGTGAELIRPQLERCDAAGIGAGLNAGSERSRDLYLRHGFEVTRRIELPFGGPPLWRMWRPPAR